MLIWFYNRLVSFHCITSWNRWRTTFIRFWNNLHQWLSTRNQFNLNSDDLWPLRCPLSGPQSGLLRQERAQFDLPVHGGGQAGATVHCRAPVNCHHRRFVPTQWQHAFQGRLPIGQLGRGGGERGGVLANQNIKHKVNENICFEQIKHYNTTLKLKKTLINADKGHLKKVKVYLLCIWLLRCWNRSGRVVLQSQRQRVDLEEPEPEQEIIHKLHLIWSISFCYLMFHSQDFLIRSVMSSWFSKWYKLLTCL